MIFFEVPKQSTIKTTVIFPFIAFHKQATFLLCLDIHNTDSICFI